MGVTATEACPLRDDNRRVNFNLRGHHTTVNIVAWNKEQMKLASCDSSGIIYVWVPNEERWSVELVNDRGIKVGERASFVKYIRHLKFAHEIIYISRSFCIHFIPVIEIYSTPTHFHEYWQK